MKEDIVGQDKDKATKVSHPIGNILGGQPRQREAGEKVYGLEGRWNNSPQILLGYLTFSTEFMIESNGSIFL